jgi:hypothetical protein
VVLSNTVHVHTVYRLSYEVILVRYAVLLYKLTSYTIVKQKNYYLWMETARQQVLIPCL